MKINSADQCFFIPGHKKIELAKKDFLIIKPPSAPWIQSFVKCQNIYLSTLETLVLGKAPITPQVLKKWADHVERYLKFFLVSMFAHCTVNATTST